MAAHLYGVTRAANVAFGRGIGNPSLGTMALIADGLGCQLAHLFQVDASDFVVLRADDMSRAREAVAVFARP
jgi:hypothetical protein